MRISDWSSDVCSSDLGEGVDQDVADDEDRKGEAEDSEPHDRAVDQGSGAPGRQDAERKRQEDRDNRRGHGEGDGRLAPLPEQFGDRSEERPVGKAWVSTVRSRRSPYP